MKTNVTTVELGYNRHNYNTCHYSFHAFNLTISVKIHYSKAQCLIRAAEIND